MSIENLEFNWSLNIEDYNLFGQISQQMQMIVAAIALMALLISIKILVQRRRERNRKLLLNEQNDLSS